jgi:hypothetical protein
LKEKGNEYDKLVCHYAIRDIVLYAQASKLVYEILIDAYYSCKLRYEVYFNLPSDMIIVVCCVNRDLN